MKKLISIFMALIMLAGASVSAVADSIEFDFPEVAKLQIGDVDADTSISSSDLTALKKILLSVQTILSKEATDLNYDGSINVVDLVRLKKKLSGAPLASLFEGQAKTLKNKVLNAEDSLPASVTRTVYHVSADGKGDSSATKGTEENPYSYAEFLEGAFAPEKGNAVVFKRGDIFRGVFSAVTGVYYGAYGSGNKPVITASAQNYANASWKSEGNNIYSVSGFSEDVGIIVFDDTEYGFKCTALSEVTAQNDFYYDSESGTLYLYTVKAPTEFESMEIGDKKSLIFVPANASKVTLDNLSLKYTGGHAVQIYTDCSNITVKNCEIGHIGGSILTGSLRFGNGIEVWCGGSNILIDNNWIYQIYDSGITHQGGGGYVLSDLTVSNNLIEYCGMGSIEYWLSYGTDSDGNLLNPIAKNITYSDNIMRFAGYCWGGEHRPDKVSSHIRSDVTCPNRFENFKVTGNIFDQSSVNLLEIGGSYGTYPIMSGNTYAQYTDGSLGVYGNNTDLVFNTYAEETIRDIFKDTTAQVYWY